MTTAFFREKKNPASMLTQAINITASYPLLHGAWPEISHRIANPEA